MNYRFQITFSYFHMFMESHAHCKNERIFLEILMKSGEGVYFRTHSTRVEFHSHANQYDFDAKMKCVRIN